MGLRKCLFGEWVEGVCVYLVAYVSCICTCVWRSEVDIRFIQLLSILFFITELPGLPDMGSPWGPSASSSQLLGLQVCATTPSQYVISINICCLETA